MAVVCRAGRHGRDRRQHGQTRLARIRQIPFEGVDSQFLAGVITYYVTHPEQRTTTGTQAALHHLQEVVDAAPAPTAAAEAPPGWISISIAALVFAAAITVSSSPAPGWVTWPAYGVAYLAFSHAAPGVWARLRKKAVQS